MKYLSLFSGIGGFELGIQQAYESNNEHAHISEESEQEERPQGREWPTDLNGIQLHDRNGTAPLCVGYSEIDKYAVQIYQKHFPNHTNYGDITKIKAEELPEFDLVVGGFPCQSFSIAGKRGGFNDTRGTMFFEIARILKAKQPRLLLLENVKGLLSHDEGRTFATIISTLDELGYDLQWQVLNSKNFGVPQNRERVFIAGHLRGTSRPQVFPITDNGGQVDELPRYLSNTLTRRYEGAQGVGTYIGEGELNAQEIIQPKRASDRVYDPAGVGPTLNTMQGGRRQPMIQQRAHGFFNGSDKDIAPSIRGASVAHNVFVDKIRRLTPLECERLQGFPDGWTEGVSDTQRYKCLGNAVTVNVIHIIMERLLASRPAIK
jgi:DNA (cytosine-5)-methyltransferase 1